MTQGSSSDKEIAAFVHRLLLTGCVALCVGIIGGSIYGWFWVAFALQGGWRWAWVFGWIVTCFSFAVTAPVDQEDAW